MSQARARDPDASTPSVVETARDAEDPRLRGRTYSVPFERVWKAALRLANGELPGFRLVSADEITGEIVAEARSPLFPRISDVTIRVSLDADAQTRLDMRSAARAARTDLGVNRRRIISFLERLDQAVDAAGAAPQGGSAAS